VATAANVADSAVLPDLLHGEENAVWGDQAYRGRSEVIRDQPPSLRAKPVPEATVFSAPKYRFTSATPRTVGAFFCSPHSAASQIRTISFITANTCSTFERTSDFVRFFARSTSSTHAVAVAADGCTSWACGAPLPDHFALPRDKPDASALRVLGAVAIDRASQPPNRATLAPSPPAVWDDLRLCYLLPRALHPEEYHCLPFSSVHLRIAAGCFPDSGRSGGAVQGMVASTIVPS